jgi:hypothetical protein
VVFEIMKLQFTHTHKPREREREKRDLVGLPFVAFGRDNGERARPLREKSNCGRLLVRKNRAEPRNGMRGTESEGAQLVV